jgi:hypothetical protein
VCSVGLLDDQFDQAALHAASVVEVLEAEFDCAPHRLYIELGVVFEEPNLYWGGAFHGVSEAVSV